MSYHVAYHRVADTPALMLSDASYSQFEFEPHYHLDYHIGLVMQGVQRQRFQGQSVLLGPGRISVMPPGEIHDGSRYRDGSYQMKTFRLSSELLESTQQEVFACHQPTEFAGAMLENPRLASQLVRLHQHIQSAGQLSPISVESLWLQLMAPLLSELCKTRPVAIKGGLSNAQMRDIEAYCHAHLADKITLPQLAKLCGLSRFQLLRRFNQHTGLTPLAWLIRLRLERACLLLRRPHQSIAEIASQVGFYDQSHFNRAFRSAYGVAPSKF